MPRRVALYTAVVLLVILLSFAWIHEMHLSPEFHAQLVQLKESTDREQEERKKQMDRLLAERQLYNARLEVDNARLDVRIADLEGRNSATARQKLRSAEAVVRTLELSENSVRDLDTMVNLISSRPPASGVVYAALADDPVVQVDHLVGDCGRSFDSQRDQRRIPALSLELHQVSRGHLAAFARDLQKTVLVNLAFDPGGQIESPPRLEPVDVFEHMLGVRLERRLPQPSKPGHAAFLLACEQMVQPPTMDFFKSISQLLVDTAIGACDRLCTDTFDRVQTR